MDEPETEDDLLPREGGDADDALAALGIKTEPDREPEPDPEEAEPWQMKWEWEVAMDAVMLELSNELANHCGPHPDPALAPGGGREESGP